MNKGEPEGRRITRLQPRPELARRSRRRLPAQPTIGTDKCYIVWSEGHSIMKVNLGNLKDKADELVAFLEPRVGTKPSLSGDSLELDDEAIRKGVKPKQVKTYIKRFLYTNKLRRDYRVFVEGGELTVQQLELGEKEKEERESVKEKLEKAEKEEKEAREEGKPEEPPKEEQTREEGKPEAPSAPKEVPKVTEKKEQTKEAKPEKPEKKAKGGSNKGTKSKS